MIAVLILVTAAFALQAPEGAEAFLEGNRRYLDGDFQEALEAYDGALEKGCAPGLAHYNAGCCLFRMGRYGEALYRFGRARAHRPRDAGVVRNIRVTRARLGLEDRTGPLGTGLAAFTVEEYLLAAGWSLALIMLLAAIRIRTGGRFGRAALWLLGLLAGFCLLGAFSASGWFGPEAGMAMTACEVLSEPSPAAGRILYHLREGETVRVEERRSGWILVNDGEHRTGWVRDGEVRLLFP